MDLEIYTVKEAAEKLKVSEAMVYRLVRDEEINKIHVGKRIMFRTKDLEEYINRGDAYVERIIAEIDDLVGKTI